jgi:Tol biopolymer transport system component
MLRYAKRHGRNFLTVTALALLPACAPDQRVTAPNNALSAAREIDDVGANVDDGAQWSAWSTPQNLGPTINSSSLEQHPAISKDGLSLYFASDRAGGFGGVDIYVSQRESLDAPWGTPVDLGPNINSSRNESAPTLSLDGHRMYFHSNGRGGCGGADLFVSRRHDKRDDFGWEPAENLGCVVNSPSADNGPTIFEDDATGITTLYFNSTRPGGLGDADIYASTRIGDEGEFGPAVLVPELSGPFRDTRTAISRDGLEMFLSSSSQGRVGGIGSEDIWVSTRPTTLDRWSTPVNLGRPVNTAFFDGGPALSFDGTTLYFHSDRQGPPGNYDIWVTTRTKLHK